MKFVALLFTALLSFCIMSFASDSPSVRVLIWDEQQAEQKLAYGERFLGGTIGAHLTRQPGFMVKCVSMDMPEQGLDDATLDAADVLIWWGHRQHDQVSPAASERVVVRVLAGKLSLIALHSSHFAQPFMRLMQERAKLDAPAMIPAGERATAKLDLSAPLIRSKLKADSPFTPSLEKTGDGYRLLPPGCIFPSWRDAGAPSHVTMLLPEHPIAQGVPAKWDIPQTEMYAEPFHVPMPDAVIFEERWDTSEHFRSGSLWQVGKGRVFYFRPGHETYPIFKQTEPLRILTNAARWMATAP